MIYVIVWLFNKLFIFWMNNKDGFKTMMFDVAGGDE